MIEYNIDDTVTFAGIYKKRTFWQWLTRQDKHLRRYVVKETG